MIIRERNKELEKLGKLLIARHHMYLAAARIAFVLKRMSEATKKRKKSGDIKLRDGKKLVIAKVAKLGPVTTVLSDYDFVIEVNERWWKPLTEKEREAVMDHELAHCGRDSRGWYIKEHDVQEFKEILERHGFYLADLREFAKAVQMHLPLQSA